MGAAEEALFSRFGKEFPKGTHLFHEGEPGREMFVIQSGKVALSKRVRDVEKVLSVVGPGEFFGEMSILTNTPRSATATVAEDAKILVIDSKTFEAMIKGNTEIAVRMIKKLVDRLQVANEQIENLLLRDPASRVAHHLMSLMEKAKSSGPARLDVQVKDLHHTLGLLPAQVDAAVQRMVKAAMIEVEGDAAVNVPDLGKLKQFMEFLEMKEKFGEMA
jgi:CRP/FNR family transcriptional regulator, cyclic AMP receptor protein